MRTLKNAIVLGVCVVLIFAGYSLARASESTGDMPDSGVDFPASPTASLAAGTYTSYQSVTLSADGATSIRYTLDNTTPTCTKGTVYSSPVDITITETLKAIACPSSANSAVASFDYIINLNVPPGDLSELVDNGTFGLPAGGTASSTLSATTDQQVIISVGDSGGTSTVTLPTGTIISSVTIGENINLNNLTASSPTEGTLSGLGTGVVVDGALQWGIANLGLQFSTPITLNIFVGTSFNGQTLNIERSTSGSSGWTSDGIVAPATCVVANGYCSFQATKASYYVVTHTTSTGGGSSGGGGGGGGGGTSATNPPTNTSIVIAGGAAATDNVNVTLTLAATNATQMTISNYSDFTGGSFETYAISKSWTLLPGDGVKTVYVKFRSSSGDVSSGVSDTITLQSAGQVLGVQRFADGAIIRAIGGIDVYVVKYVGAKQFKRLILSPSVFNSYGHLKWENILDVEKSVVDSFTTSDLVRAAGDTKVYKLTPSGDIGTKQWIKTAAVFNSRGFDWDSVYEINNVDRDSYTTGANIE